MILSSYLTQILKEQVVGQESAVAAAARAVTLALAGRCYDYRPLAVLLFAGPIGAGKTHLVQALARVMVGHERKLIYINCQQLSQSADPLLNLNEQFSAGYWFCHGIPPSQPISFNPCFLPHLSMMIFEEIDKAPPTFRDYLAAAIDRGELHAGGGFFSLRNAFIVLTSHLSRKKTDQIIGRSIGFSREDENEDDLPHQHIAVLEEVDNMLGTYLVNNIDEIVFFEQLTERYILILLERRLAEIERYLALSSIGFIISSEAKTFLLKPGLEDLGHGMRQLNRAVRNYLEFPLADLMLSGRLAPGTTVEINYEPRRTFLHFQILIPQFIQPQEAMPTPCNITVTDSVR